MSLILALSFLASAIHGGANLRLLALHLLVRALLLLLLLRLLVLAQRRQGEDLYLAPLLSSDHRLGAFFKQKHRLTTSPLTNMFR
jgi:hypothetical protein